MLADGGPARGDVSRFDALTVERDLVHDLDRVSSVPTSRAALLAAGRVVTRLSGLAALLTYVPTLRALFRAPALLARHGLCICCGVLLSINAWTRSPRLHVLLVPPSFHNAGKHGAECLRTCALITVG